MIFCPIATSLMHGVAIRYVQHSQAILERGVYELFHSRNSYDDNKKKKIMSDNRKPMIFHMFCYLLQVFGWVNQHLG